MRIAISVLMGVGGRNGSDVDFYIICVITQ